MKGDILVAKLLMVITSPIVSGMFVGFGELWRGGVVEGHFEVKTGLGGKLVTCEGSSPSRLPYQCF